MSKEAMKLALGKIKSARECHPNAVDALLFEAEEILEEALAGQPAQQEPVTDEENEKFSRDVSGFKGADPEATKYALEEFLRNRVPAIGDIRALKHRIHALEGDVIGYKQLLDAAEQPPQQEPVRIYDYVWPQRDEHKEECVYTCSYTPGHHLVRGELLAVVHPSQLKNAYLQRNDKAAHGIKEST